MFCFVGISGWTYPNHCAASCQAQPITVQDRLARWEGTCICTYTCVYSGTCMFLYWMLSLMVLTTFPWCCCVCVCVCACACSLQISTLADHNEELMKLKHAGPWSKLHLHITVSSDWSLHTWTQHFENKSPWKWHDRERESNYTLKMERLFWTSCGHPSCSC